MERLGAYRSFFPSLRRHDPDQVLRVWRGRRHLSPAHLAGHPSERAQCAPVGLSGKGVRFEISFGP